MLLSKEPVCAHVCARVCTCVHTCACACVLAHVCPCRTQVCARVCVCARVLHVCACVAHTCAPPLRHTPSGTEHTALVLTALRQQPEGAACRTSGRGGGARGTGAVFANTREVDRGPGRTPCGWTQVDSRRSTTVRAGMWSREHRHAPLRTRLHQVCPDGCTRSHAHTPQPARNAETCVAGFWGRGTAAPPPAAAAPPASRGQPERAALAHGGSGHPALRPVPVPTTTRGPSMAFGQRASWPPGVRAREADVRNVEARGRLCARCPGTDPDTPGLLATGPWTCDGGWTVLDRAELCRGIRTRQMTDGWRRGSVTPGVRETRMGAPPPKKR